jgi:hypothetical protein
MYRPSDNLVKSSGVSQLLKSDHYTITCELNIESPRTQPVFKNVRSLRTIDTVAFKADIEDSLLTVSSAADLDSALRSVLDKHAPSQRRAVRTGKEEPWYEDVRDDFVVVES